MCYGAIEIIVVLLLLLLLPLPILLLLLLLRLAARCGTTLAIALKRSMSFLHPSVLQRLACKNSSRQAGVVGDLTAHFLKVPAFPCHLQHLLLHQNQSSLVPHSDILVLKLISVLVFILFSTQNFYFILF